MRLAAARLATPLIGAVWLAGCATTTFGPPEVVPGYLASAQLAELVAAVPQPPALTGTEQAQDVALSERLRTLEDTDRWWMATAHAELRPPEAAQHFDCLLGTRLAAKPRPALNRLMGRLLADSERLTVDLVARHPRLRPLAADPARRACQRLNEATRKSPTSYPAAGAVAGAAYGALFADLAPDRAEASRQMGREIGLSRAICATNWLSDVQAGAALGEALYDAAASQPEFATDLAAARLEIASARAEGATNPSCASERLALTQGRAIMAD
ncbi:MAG: PA-phosphatase [Brevundimonas sp.]|uniref:PA-phosphatase n=1 Tax=Brevundimonas sp. TaxID=1871086 RepID=UPI001A2156E2|nr:PA-phosphatase [Brevundimonas sp.]MBJ7448401.1 PA-phosphatase [Brevundimonas sp.]